MKLSTLSPVFLIRVAELAESYPTLVPMQPPQLPHPHLLGMIYSAIWVLCVINFLEQKHPDVIANTWTRYLSPRFHMGKVG